MVCVMESSSAADSANAGSSSAVNEKLPRVSPSEESPQTPQLSTEYENEEKNETPNTLPRLSESPSSPPSPPQFVILRLPDSLFDDDDVRPAPLVVPCYNNTSNNVPISPANDPVESPLTREAARLLARGGPKYNSNYRQFVNCVFCQNESQVHSFGTYNNPLEMMAVIMPDFSFQGTNGGNGCNHTTRGRHQIMVTMHTPANSLADLCVPYSPSVADYEFSENFNFGLAQLLDSMGMQPVLSHIRMLTTVQCFVSPNFSPMVKLVLYGNLIAWVRVPDGVEADGSIRDVKSSTLICMVRLQHDYFEARLDDSDERIINMWIGEPKFRLSMAFSGPDVALLFIDMLGHKKLRVPVCQREFNLMCDSIRRNLMPLTRSRGVVFSDIVSNRVMHSILCVPKSLFDDPVTLLTLWGRISSMDANEELSIVVYSSKGVYYISPFMDRDPENWREIISTKFIETIISEAVPHYSSSSSGSAADAASASKFYFNGFSIDALLQLCCGLFRPQISSNSWLQLTMVADENLPMKHDTPSLLTKRNVAMHMIGLGGNHNIKAFNRICESLEGHYTFLEDANGLHTAIQRHQNLVRRGFLRNLKVTLRPRLHTQVTGVTYDDTFYKTGTDKFFNGGNNEYIWNIGRMNADETRTFFIHFQGDLYPGDSALRVNIEFEDLFMESIRPFSQRMDLRAPLLNFNLPPGALNQIPSQILSFVQVEYQMSVAYKRMTSLLNIMLHDAKRSRLSVFNVMNYIEHLKKLDLGPDFDGPLKALQTVCRSQLNHTTQERFTKRENICQLVRDIWALRSRRSLTDRDNFGTFFTQFSS